MATSIEEAISQREKLENQYDKTVRQEIETFRTKAMAFLAGEITETDFRPFRLKHGIYGQRQAGVQMVRCKIPGGLLTAPQAGQLARIADEFAGGKAHLTTRQNIQYHFVPLARVAGLMHLLADVGLTNREACYNTVRNVTVCPLAGIARDEVFDVRPYAQKVAYAFLRKDLTGNLPRKFKIAFDGCAGQDSIASASNDIGLRAVVREGRRGFHVVIGGGLGPLPTEAQLLDEFVPEERLLNWCEAVIRVFNQYGTGQNKNTARMKFVMRTRGLAWMKEQIAKEYDDILTNGGIEWPAIVPEGFGGYQSHPQPLGLGAGGAGQIDDVITCPGAYTCNLGITKTMNLGAALQQAVRQYDDPRVRRLTIKASGCPNACGHHWIADFGFYGNARKIDGREVPYYQMLLGGGYDDQGIMRFGLAVQSIPARLGPEAVQRVIAHFQANRLDGESFRDYVLRHKIETFRELTSDLAKPAELFPEIYQDWGDTEAYSLKLGRGECAV